jgi:adenylyltransferase/sulfurtransferase
VLTGKPLVSASAVKTEGQLIVLNNPPRPPGDEGSPCYRCIFPKPPPPDTVTSCADGGVLGPVVGTMGVLQALEAIKALTADPVPTRMLVFSAYEAQQFRNVMFRRRKMKCLTCGENPEITLPMFESIDYATFCGILDPINLLRPEERVEPEEYQRARGQPHVLIDTRDKTQFSICHLEGSLNVPMENLKEQDTCWKELKEDVPVYMICRLGNDSQEAVKILKNRIGNDGPSIVDIKGGLRAWREKVDSDFPDY